MPPLSIPSSSGSWLRTPPVGGRVSQVAQLSIPSSSGSWLRNPACTHRPAPAPPLSIPSSSGSWLRIVAAVAVPAHFPLSIPSSSGSWLRNRGEIFGSALTIDHFQSPLHRGHGCESDYGSRSGNSSRIFQSPLHRGHGCEDKADNVYVTDLPLSIPSSSGSWLRTSGASGASGRAGSFQSPLHRGHGCELDLGIGPLQPGQVDFQSPLHRGHGCEAADVPPADAPDLLSIPSSSGSWLRSAG